jgi:hypothetical protein
MRGTRVAIASCLDDVALQVVLATELLITTCARVWLQPCNMTDHYMLYYEVTRGAGNWALIHLCACTCGGPECPCQDNEPHILGKSMCRLPNGSRDGVAPDLTSVWSSLCSPHTQTPLPANTQLFRFSWQWVFLEMMLCSLADTRLLIFQRNVSKYPRDNMVSCQKISSSITQLVHLPSYTLLLGTGNQEVLLHSKWKMLGFEQQTVVMCMPTRCAVSRSSPQQWHFPGPVAVVSSISSFTFVSMTPATLRVMTWVSPKQLTAIQMGKKCLLMKATGHYSEAVQ